MLLLVGCVSTGDNSETTAPDSSGAALDTNPVQTEPAAAERTDALVAQYNALGESPDDNYRTFYEIFVYSFCDSDGDGIGDLQGVISKLDYLQELGITGIWFMPIHPSTSYHKYNVSDYYAIDPQYGTMEDFEALIAECEKRDIHVIIDLVVNHTGSEHLWFKEAVSYLQSLPAGAEPSSEECKYLDYYFFSKEEGKGSRPVEGTDWFYEGMFDYTMPDINLGSQATREEIKNIMQFWLDKGVAGFRLDAAKEFYSGSVSKNVEVLSWIQETATSIKPDCYLVAEVWENFNQITAYYESGITSIFNFAFGNADGKITKVLQGAGNESVVTTYATALEKADTAYRGMNPDYIDAPFLSNHDVGRIAGFAGRDENKMKMAAAMNLFMGGSAFIYYGEEIGMRNLEYAPAKEGSVSSRNRSVCRTPMQWDKSKNAGFSTADPAKLYLPVDNAPSYPNVAEQLTDPNSVLNYVSDLIALRQATPALGVDGDWKYVGDLDNPYPMIYARTLGDEKYVVVFNPADRTVTGSIPAMGKKAEWVFGNNRSLAKCKSSKELHSFTMKPISVAIYKIK